MKNRHFLLGLKFLKVESLSQKEYKSFWSFAKHYQSTF